MHTFTVKQRVHIPQIRLYLISNSDAVNERQTNPPLKSIPLLHSYPLFEDAQLVVFCLFGSFDAYYSPKTSIACFFFCQPSIAFSFSGGNPYSIKVRFLCPKFTWAWGNSKTKTYISPKSHEELISAKKIIANIVDQKKEIQNN